MGGDAGSILARGIVVSLEEAVRLLACQGNPENVLLRRMFVDNTRAQVVEFITTMLGNKDEITTRPALRDIYQKAVARFFRQNQLPSGAFPSFFGKEFLAPRRDRLYDGSAETGSVANFLIEFGTITGDDEAIGAARRALDLIDRLLAKGQWLDVESIAARTPIVDPRSGLPRQGTLGLIQCALAAARFGTVRPAPKWRRLTDRLLGQLSRYQQVWSPPWIPGALVGGFGAGNFDHRWNDARQGLAARAFFAGYQLTEDPQWLDRGIAALDAALLTRDRDHQPPRDGEGPRSSLHWGPGSACTVAFVLDLLALLWGEAGDDDRGFLGHDDRVFDPDAEGLACEVDRRGGTFFRRLRHVAVTVINKNVIWHGSSYLRD